MRASGPPWATEAACVAAVRAAAQAEALRATHWPESWKRMAIDALAHFAADGVYKARQDAGRKLLAALSTYERRAADVEAYEAKARGIARLAGADAGEHRRLLKALRAVSERVAENGRLDDAYYWGGDVNGDKRKPDEARRRVASMFAKGSFAGLDVLDSDSWPAPKARDLALMAICAGVPLPPGWRTMSVAELIRAEARAMRAYLPAVRAKRRRTTIG